MKKGMSIEMNSWAAHHCPEFFPEPNEFRPERFLKENSAQIINHTFRGFGGGQRVCIGQRFAMVEMKIAAAKLLQKFRFVATPSTKLEIFTGDIFMLGYPDFAFKVEERNDDIIAS